MEKENKVKRYWDEASEDYNPKIAEAITWCYYHNMNGKKTTIVEQCGELVANDFPDLADSYEQYAIEKSAELEALLPSKATTYYSSITNTQQKLKEPGRSLIDYIKSLKIQYELYRSQYFYDYIFANAPKNVVEVIKRSLLIQEYIPQNLVFGRKKSRKSSEKGKYLLRKNHFFNEFDIITYSIDEEEAALFASLLLTPEIGSIMRKYGMNYNGVMEMLGINKRNSDYCRTANVDKKTASHLSNMKLFNYLTMGNVDGLTLEKMALMLIKGIDSTSVGIIYSTIMESTNPHFYEKMAEQPFTKDLEKAIAMKSAEANPEEAVEASLEGAQVKPLGIGNINLTEGSYKLSDILNIGFDIEPTLSELSLVELQIRDTGFDNAKEYLQELAGLINRGQSSTNLFSLFRKKDGIAVNNSLISTITEIVENLKLNMGILRSNIERFQQHTDQLANTFIPQVKNLIEALKEKEQETEKQLEEKEANPENRLTLVTLRMAASALAQKIQGLEIKSTTAQGLILSECEQLKQLINAYYQSDLTVNVLIPMLIDQLSRSKRDSREKESTERPIVALIEAFATDNQSKMEEARSMISGSTLEASSLEKINQINTLIKEVVKPGMQGQVSDKPVVLSKTASS